MKKENYWWDFSGKGSEVIVQSERCECLRAFDAIPDAESFIADLQAGRIALNADGSVKADQKGG